MLALVRTMAPYHHHYHFFFCVHTTQIENRHTYRTPAGYFDIGVLTVIVCLFVTEVSTRQSLASLACSGRIATTRKLCQSPMLQVPNS